MGRKVHLAYLGTVFTALAGVASVMWPQHSDRFTQLAAAVAALCGAVALFVGYEDAATKKAEADVEAARYYAAVAAQPGTPAVQNTVTVEKGEGQ